MMRPLVLAGLYVGASAQVDHLSGRQLDFRGFFNQCDAPVQDGPTEGAGAGNVVSCHDETGDGSCAIYVQRSNGQVLADGDSYAPGEQLTVAVMRACQLDPAVACGDGFQVIIDVAGTTFPSGAGTTNCDGSRLLNPFMNPIITAPADGSDLVINAGTGYCRGTSNEDTEDITSACTDSWHVADAITLSAGSGAPSCPGDVDGETVQGDGVFGPPDRSFFKVDVDDLLMLLANYGNYCEDPRSVPPAPPSSGTGGDAILIGGGPTGPVERVVNGELNGPVVDNTIPGFNTHNCEVSIVDWEGRTGVLRNRDAGGFSDIYQTINTVAGATYALEFDVWATPIHNTAGNAYCTSTDSNGLVAIAEGAVQMGCGVADGYCAHGETRLCPSVDGGWTTVSGDYTATTDASTFRMHGESGYDAYFDRISLVGPAPTANIIVNGALDGPVVDNTIAGWNTHNCAVSIVDWEGRTGVLKNADAGGFSDIYQSAMTTPAMSYLVSYDVWATPIHNTAGNAYCTSTDSNGLMAIVEGAVQMGCGLPDGYCDHGEMRICPSVDGGWETVTGTYTANTDMTTFRLHGESGYDAYFDNVAVAPIMGPSSTCEAVVNGDLNGPVVDNSIAGWNTHNCAISIADWEGRTGVLKNADAGGFSDIYQSINTIPGGRYEISFDVWATPIHNTAGNAYCTSTDSNGLMAIADGAVQMGCGVADGYCAHGETRLCPSVDGGWETVSGSYTATGMASTFRLHGESGYDAYFDTVSVVGPCVAGQMNVVVNGDLDGPVVDNTIAGWSTHNCAVSIVDWEGETGVLKNADAGGFSDIYQSINTIPGTVYDVEYKVYATPIHNTAGNPYCTSTDSNGLLAIAEGAVQMGCGVADGYCAHGEYRICPEVDGVWTVVSGQYTAMTPMTTFRLHGESGYDAYFDYLSITTAGAPPAICERAVNPSLDGPVVDNTIAGWSTHNCEVSIVDWEGETGVLKNADAGGFSDIYQAINTIPGEGYSIAYTVWATPIHNTAGNAYCTSTDSNGLMAIAEGAVTMGCGMTDGYCAHGEVRICPSVDGGWETVTGVFTATSTAATFRLHGESGYDAYFKEVSVQGPCPSGNIIVNGDLSGPVVDNTIAGFNTHNCAVSIVDWEGRTGVLKNADAGGFSDIYQSAPTMVGVTYDVSFDVWATPIHNTAGNAYCTSTDSNGLLAIVVGAVQMGCGLPDGYCAHGEYRICPEVDGGWTTVTGTYTASSDMTTFRLHGESGFDAYFDNLNVIAQGGSVAPPASCDMVVNGDLNGPVVDNTIAGWNTHNCAVSIVDWEGRTGVLKNADAGGFSDIYQSIVTTPGAAFDISYDVWATPIHNTAGNAYCTSTDSNGLLAIAEGAVQMGCGVADGYCAHGEMRICPSVDGGWETVTGTYTAVAPMTTFRLHGESGYDAYFDSISIVGPCPTGNIVVNPELDGPVVDNTIAGYNTHNCAVSIVDWEGRTAVLKNADAGGFSDIYQSVNTVVGQIYNVAYDVWATPIHNTAGNAYCTSTDSNGLMAITEGAVQMGCGVADGYCAHGEMRICPSTDGGWETVTGTYTATTDMTTFRLHGESGYDAYFDRVEWV